MDLSREDHPLAEHTSESASPLPWLQVSQLAEFVFCARAGLLAVELAEAEAEHPLRMNLDFAPPYSLAELEATLQRQFNLLWAWCAAAFVTLTAAGCAYVWERRWLALLAGALLVLFAAPLARQLERCLQLVRLRHRIRSAPAGEPVWDLTTEQAVDWWQLLAAGWLSVRNHEAYQDAERSLSGRPWRTLRRGDLTIPVFKLPHFSPTQGLQLFPQHVMRMAAYCQLIESCEGRSSPAGIVLFGESYQGVTVPATPTARAAVEAALAQAREVLEASNVLERDPAPPAPAWCAGCPWGLPRIFREGVTEISRDGELVPVYGRVLADRRLYHSPCGDRFAWRPPHELALRQGLA